jgi:DNA-binding PadR family transcriptional regulator
MDAMTDRATRDAVAEAVSVEAARAAAGGPGVAGAPSTAAAGGSGTTDPLVGELRRGGLLPLLVLHFLGEEPSYGNQLMDRVTATTGGLLKVNPNTMYPLLRKLEGKGLIAGEWEHPERRSRRFYRLTEAGAGERDGLRAELGPRLDAVARGVELIRAELSG